jgi:uncharacterized protein YjbI with pentapeptide repeats
MTQDDPSEILLRGAKVWNVWREQYRGPLNFAAPRWYESPGTDGVQVKGRNRLDFSEMNLSGATIYRAFAEGLNLRNTVFEDAHFEEGDFSRADFTGASFRSTRFNKTILTGANFDGATFVNCNLNRINLVGASFRVKEISETVVYGIAAWDLQTSDQMKQSKLVIERTYDLYSDIIQQGKVPLTVDDIELAQFVYYLSNHKKMRDALNILNDKGVLLLGRFKDGGLERLYSIRERLQSKGYMAMIFDFARPDNLSLTETVVTMAGLSKFIVVDLSGSSVPAELQSILSQIKKPILAFGNAYAMFPDVADQTDVLTIEGGDDSKLLNDLEERLPDLESLHAKRIVDLARRYEKGEKERLRTG